MRAKTLRLTMCGVLFGIALTLSALEGMIELPSLPGIKLGISNIVVMYAQIVLGFPYALAIAVLKAVYVLSARGVSAGIISLCGGLLSVAVMAAVGYCRSPLLTGIFGGIAHNIGQLGAASLILGTRAVFWYLPVLIISGTATGSLTGLTLKILMPYVGRFRRTNEKTRRFEAPKQQGKSTAASDGHIGAAKHKDTA